MDKKTIKVRKYKKHDYEVRTELVRHVDTEIEMRSAYNSNGDYIGTPEDAFLLIRQKGIRPEKAKESDSVCSIGYCEKEEKFYGWSHRAICGFAIGDKIEKDSVVSEYLPVGFKAKTFEDIKKMAIAFADSVG